MSYGSAPYYSNCKSRSLASDIPRDRASLIGESSLAERTFVGKLRNLSLRNCSKKRSGRNQSSPLRIAWPTIDGMKGNSVAAFVRSEK